MRLLAAVFAMLLPCQALAAGWDDSPATVIVNKDKKGAAPAVKGSAGKRAVRVESLPEEEFIDIREAMKNNGSFGPVKTPVRKKRTEAGGEPAEAEGLKPVASGGGGEKKSISELETPKIGDRVKSVLEEPGEEPEAGVDAPPIENVRQEQFVREDDPFVRRKDVSKIPFKFRDGEKVDVFIDPRNIDDLALWRDMRDNEAVNGALLDGVVDVWMPPLDDAIAPSMIFAYALEKDRAKALDFIDYVAFQAEGWLDARRAAWLGEKEREQKGREVDEALDAWMRRAGLEPDELYDDRGVMLKTARSMNEMEKRRKSMAKGDKHPAVYVNGRERSAYFEPIRSLPPNRR